MCWGRWLRLATLIFHELAHQRFYVKDDTEFNESFANFVEQRGQQMVLIGVVETHGITVGSSRQLGGLRGRQTMPYPQSNTSFAYLFSMRPR